MPTCIKHLSISVLRILLSQQLQVHVGHELKGWVRFGTAKANRKRACTSHVSGACDLMLVSCLDCFLPLQDGCLGSEPAVRPSLQSCLRVSGVSGTSGSGSDEPPLTVNPRDG